MAQYVKDHKETQIKIPTKSVMGRNIEIELAEVTALLCYANPESSELRYLVNEGQRHLIADKINNEILSMT